MTEARSRKTQDTRTVTLGLHRTLDEYRNAFRQGGFRLEPDADGILEQVALSADPTEIRLALCTGSDLGFKSKFVQVRYDAIRARAKERHGYEPCPAEAGLALRLVPSAYPQLGEWLNLAMDPIVGKDGRSHGFSVRTTGAGVRSLGVYDGATPEDLWLNDNTFVFLIP